MLIMKVRVLIFKLLLNNDLKKYQPYLDKFERALALNFYPVECLTCHPVGEFHLRRFKIREIVCKAK